MRVASPHGQGIATASDRCRTNADMTVSGGDVRQCISLVVLVAVIGCNDARRPSTPTPERSLAPAKRFDPTTTGRITGRVSWTGESPVVPAILATIPDGNQFRFTHKPNPFAPQIREGGLVGAVVFLRRVDPVVSKPWTLPPATVEQREFELHIRQGDSPPGATGFTPLGSMVSVVTRNIGPATVRLRGAAFATLPFPGPDQPIVHRFATAGVVEVTSGTMLSWAACDLIVCDHPYYTVTDSTGRFTLDDVPPGEYQLACRVRNWHEIGSDRDPETGLITRRRFAPPVEQSAMVQVTTRGTIEHDFTFSSTSFPSR